jgi:hypothetical protein
MARGAGEGSDMSDSSKLPLLSDEPSSNANAAAFALQSVRTM